MTGLLPGNCKTVNEAAAWAIEELCFRATLAEFGMAEQTDLMFDHDQMIKWLALRNDWARLNAANEIAELKREIAGIRYLAWAVKEGNQLSERELKMLYE